MSGGTAGEMMGLHLVNLEFQAGFGSANQRPDHFVRIHLAQAHADQGEQTHRHAGEKRGNPQSNRNEVEKQQERQGNHHDGGYPILRLDECGSFASESSTF